MRTINITIKADELMHDIAQWGYTSGESLSDDTPKQKALIQTPTEEGQDELMHQVLEDAWAEILQIVKAYTYHNVNECGCPIDCHEGKPVSDNVPGDFDEGCICHDFEVTLYFPDNTAPTLSANIGRLCKRYMIMRARAEWETITRQDSRLSQSTAEMTARRLKVEITGRTTVGKQTHTRHGYTR